MKHQNSAIRADTRHNALVGKTSLRPLQLSRSGFEGVPDFIKENKTACEVFTMVAEHLKTIGVIQAVDCLQLANYAVLQAEFADFFQEHNYPDTTPAVLTALRNYSYMFGLDPISRSKIMLDNEGKEDETAERLRQQVQVA